MIRQLNKLKQFNFEKFFTWSIQTFYWILWKKKFTILRIDISYFLPFTSFSLLSCRTIMHKSLSNSPIILTQNRQWRTPVKKQWIPHPPYHVPDFHSIRPTRQFQVKKKKKKAGDEKTGEQKREGSSDRPSVHRYNVPLLRLLIPSPLARSSFGRSFYLQTERRALSKQPHYFRYGPVARVTVD